MYYVYLPKHENGIEKFDLCHKSRSIIDCLLYVYGYGDFKLTNNTGLSLLYREKDFKDFCNSNFTEPFFCLIKDLLTSKELDKFKKKLRKNIY